MGIKEGIKVEEVTTEEMEKMVHTQLLAYLARWPTNDNGLQELAEHIARNLLQVAKVTWRYRRRAQGA